MKREIERGMEESVRERKQEVAWSKVGKSCTPRARSVGPRKVGWEHGPTFAGYRREYVWDALQANGSLMRSPVQSG